MENQSNTPPASQQPPAATSVRKSSMFFIIIVSILISGISFGLIGYSLGRISNQPTFQKTTPIFKTNTSSLSNPTGATTSTTPLSSPTEKPSGQFKISLHEHWKRIRIVNMGFSFQIPDTWRAGYCRNNVKNEFTEISFMLGDSLFLASDSAEYSGTICSDYPLVWKPIRFETQQEMQSFLDNLVKPTNGLARKTESLTINGAKVEIVHLDWCEGLKERELNNSCLPITGGGSKHEYIKIPDDLESNNTDFDYVVFNFLLPEDILKTIEFN